MVMDRPVGTLDLSKEAVMVNTAFQGTCRKGGELASPAVNWEEHRGNVPLGAVHCRWHCC